VVKAADWYELRLANGGGFGDPLDRDPELVERDIREGRVDKVLAQQTYGVIAGDQAATAALRERMRFDRLMTAKPPAKPLSRNIRTTGTALPLYPGVLQYGNVAVAEASGAPLAMAPDHWTEGCAVLTERRWPKDGPDVVYRSYLDPETGRVLHVEVVLGDEPRTFMVAPHRWTEAGKQHVAA
jgi:N-methylhydantoinase B